MGFGVFLHPENVCMTYLNHFLFVLEMTWYLGVGCVKSLARAFIPDIFVTSTSETVTHIQYRLSQVGCRRP